MRAYFEVTFPSWGIGRIAYQMGRYLPDGVVGSGDPGGGTGFTVMHVIGRLHHMEGWARDVLASGGQYAVVQYVLESCRNPNPKDWKWLWDNAKVVMSYYDLEKYTPSNFYHAPLAADPLKFYKTDSPKKFLVGANGDDYARECVGEVRLGAYQAQGKVAHVGRNNIPDPNVTYFKDITDDEERDVYNSCQWWSALRRKDGFEMPAVEAAMCGVRPIMFDTPNYRQWFDGIAEFVPEVESAELAGRLKRIFLDGPKPLTDLEIESVKQKFNWEKIMRGFWDRCMS